MHIFISHSSKDQQLVEDLCRRFDRKKISYWVSYKHISSGKNFSKEIPVAIHNASIFLVFLSQNAIESSYVPLEIQAAVDEKKTIIPIIVGDVEVPADIRFLLSSSQVLPYANTSAFYKNLINRILEFLDTSPDIPSAEAAPLSFHGDTYRAGKRKQAAVTAIIVGLLIVGLLIGALALGISMAGRSSEKQLSNSTHSQSTDENTQQATDDTATDDTTTNTTTDITADAAPDEDKEQTVTQVVGVDELKGKYDKDIAAFDAMDTTFQQFRTCTLQVGEQKVPSFISLWTDSAVYSQNTGIATADGIVITGVSVGETYIVCLPQPTAPAQVLKIIVTE